VAVITEPPRTAPAAPSEVPMYETLDLPLDPNLPTGPIAEQWEQRRFEMKLVNPANRRRYTIIIVGSGLAGGAAAATLGEAGFNVVTQTTYRMTPVKHLPNDVSAGFAAHGIEAVLHYSRRSAQAFLEAARGEGVEISALSIPQCCLSETVAGVLREAGAPQVAVAASADENALFSTLERALRTRLA